MTLVNAVMKVKYGDAPDKGRAVVATCGLLESAWGAEQAGFCDRPSKWSRGPAMRHPLSLPDQRTTYIYTPIPFPKCFLS